MSDHEDFLFRTYFDVADELDGGLTIDELDRNFLDDAREAAARFTLPWPPDLAYAEEVALSRRNES